MKRTNTLLLGLTLVTSLTLTSCEVDFYEPYYPPTTGGMDRDQSMALSGQWTGDFGMFYTYQVGGRTMTFDSYDSDVVFYPEYNGARRGWGKEVDFYETGPYEYIYHELRWEIRDGILYLTYPSDPDMDCWIRDYRMTNDYFTGYFGNSTQQFRLRKLADHYDWTPYVDTESYGDRRDWYSGPYYMKAKSDTTSTGITGCGRR